MLEDFERLYIGAGLVVLIAGLFLWLGSVSTYQRFFGPALAPWWTLRRRIVFSLVSFGIGAGAIIKRISDVDARGDAYRHLLSYGPPALMGQAVGRTQFPGIFLELLCRGLLFVLIFALAAKLYGKWIASGATEEEKAPGARGFKAALSLSNLLCVVAIAACAYFADVLSPFLALFIGLICLLAGPALMMMSDSQRQAPTGAAAAPVAESAGLAEQRDRVMKLLEAGRINAEESAELLNALAASSAAGPTVEPMTLNRKLSLAGAALVLIGFFIPWFAINLGEEMSRLTGDMQKSMQQSTQSFGMPSPFSQMQMTATANGFPAAQFPQVTTGTVTVSGGDIAHGLGWLILSFGIGAALLPYIATGLAPHTRRSVTLLALAAGAIMLAYLSTSQFGHISFGIPVVFIGYLLELTGILREMNLLPAPSGRLNLHPSANQM